MHFVAGKCYLRAKCELNLLNDFLPFFFSLFSVLLTGQQRCRPRQVRRWCGGCRRCWQPVRRQPRLLRRSFAPLCIYMNLHPTRTHPLLPPHLPLSLVPPHAHTLAQWQTTLPERQSSHSVTMLSVSEELAAAVKSAPRVRCHCVCVCVSRGESLYFPFYPLSVILQLYCALFLKCCLI